MKFKIKKHYYMGNGYRYDLYWMNNNDIWTRHDTVFGSVQSAEDCASVIKIQIESDENDELMAEFEL